RDGTVLEWHADSGAEARDSKDLVEALGVAAAPTPLPTTHYAQTVAPDARPRDIDDQKDDILRAKNLPAGYVMDPATAYVLVGLMQDVIRYGTGTGANLGRPAAGKTGTTNDAGDAWFMGYTPDLVAGVWVGFDDKKPLGASETGGHTAVPIWTSFMVEAIKGIPARDFLQPAGIVRLQIDRESGLRACPETDTPVWVPYKEGTEPQDYVCRRGTVPNGMPQQNGTTTNGVGVGSGLPSGLPPD
ncbi:MAG TPA: penicillin-binding transpeptidase domain-containing protein, partial [bacterium]|nr:penicillin-binding transpeptidase domain-containing protein [bacterium]